MPMKFSISFDMYDANNSGEIDASEVIQLMQDVYGKNLNGNIHAQAVLNKLSKSNNTFSAVAFAEFASKNPALLFPAFMAQEKLQAEIMGFGFWRRISAIRDKQKEKVNMAQIRRALFRCKHQMKRRASSIIFRRASVTITRMMSNGLKSLTHSPKKPQKQAEESGKAKPVSKKSRNTTVKRVSPIVATAAAPAGIESNYLKLDKVDANHAQQQLATDRSVSGHDSTHTSTVLSSHNTSHFNYDKY